MKNRETYQFNENMDDQLKSHPQIEMPFSKSKEEVWAELSDAIEGKVITVNSPLQKQRRSLFMKPLFYAAAFVVLLLLTVLFASLYSKQISTDVGEHILCQLPDNSSVELNAASTLSYKPFWWRYSRQVKFEGEGFFKVQKGERFDVISAKGTTSVLGTSFNIYARENSYTVTCLTGRVKVANSLSSQSSVIIPNQQAIVLDNGSVVSHSLKDASNAVSWKDNMFIFTAIPIQTVFKEIERQYGVRIIYGGLLNYNYTGNFNREQNIDDVMHNICVAFGLNYKKVDGSIVVSK